MQANSSPRRGRRATGSITEHRGRDGKTYRTLRFTAHGKRRTEPLGAVTKAEAEKALRGLVSDIERGIWQPPRSTPIESAPQTFGQLAQEWIDRSWPELAATTRADYLWRLQSHLLPFFGELPVAALDIAAVDRYKAAKLREGDRIRAAADAGEPLTEQVTSRRGRTYSRELRPLSPRSINMTLVLLASIMEMAVERELIARNPAAGKRRRVKEPKRGRSHIDNAAHVAALLDAAAELDREAREDRRHVERRAMIAILIFAGVRIGELFALRWRHVDLASGWLHVAGTKTDAAERRVRISGALRDELTALKARRPGEPDAFLFLTATGKTMGDDNFRNRVLARAVTRASENLTAAGLAPLPDRITPHSLRRTFCSIQYALGVDPGTIMDEMGHTDANLSLRIYRQSMRRNGDEKAALRALVEGPASDPAAAFDALDAVPI